MLVRVLAVADNGTETEQATCDLWECFPDNDAEYLQARAELVSVGRYWVGGGAAPLFLLMRATEGPQVPRDVESLTFGLTAADLAVTTFLAGHDMCCEVYTQMVDHDGSDAQICFKLAMGLTTHALLDAVLSD